MTTRVTANITMSNASNALFQAWAQEIDAAILAAGWVDNGDTGSVNLATMTVPAQNTAAGFRIYKMQDSLHTGGSSPCYLKVEYGTGAGFAGTPGLWITIGTSTNGSGTLTGNTSTRTAWDSQGNGTASGSVCYSSGSTSRIGLFMGTPGTVGSNVPFVFFHVSRIKNSSGADLADGFILVMSWRSNTTTATTSRIQFVAAVNSPFTTTTMQTDYIYSLYPKVGNSFSTSGFGLWGIVPVVGKAYPTSYDMGVYISGDIYAGANITFTIGSATYTWKALGVSISTVAVNTPQIFMRWE